MAGPHLSAHLDPVTVGKPHVEHRHIGVGRGDPSERLLGSAGLPDDDEVLLRLQQLSDPTANDLMVVEEEHPRLRHAISVRTDR